MQLPSNICYTVAIFAFLVSLFARFLYPRDTPEDKYGKDSAFDVSLYHSHQSPYRENPCQPSKIHLAQATNVAEESAVVNMTLSFSLDYQDCSNARATVVYGTSSFPEGTAGTSERMQFEYASTATGELNYQSDWIHHVVLPKLKAGRQMYWYRIVVHMPNEERRKENLRAGNANGAKVGESPTYTFATPPVSHQPTSLALVGDLGQTENSTKTMHHIFKAATAPETGDDAPPPVTALLIAGDLSYADGDPHRWERWLDIMEPLLRRLPLQAAGGNHEIECDNKTSAIFVPYENYFRNPNRIGPPDMEPVPEDYRKTLWRGQCTTSSELLGHYNYGNSFYSFQHGLAHVIVLNSYTDSLPGSPQYDWLEHEFSQEVDRDRTPWLLVMFHCPLHTTFVGHNNEINPRLMILGGMEALFVQYNVNFVVNGHDHGYMRTTPMVGKKTDETGKGPIYLTLGAGGNREQHNEGYLHPHKEDWVVKRDLQEYGYGHLHLANATHAHLNWVRDGTTKLGTRDHVWLTNQNFL